MMMTNLDMDCLRTFVTIVDQGSFARAAQTVGRTTPAVSLQITRLEDQLRTKLFQKSGRRMVLSPEGEQLISLARQILALNDRAVESLHHNTLRGEVSIGAIQDFADTFLPAVLSTFKASHPDVRITARVDRSRNLVTAVDNGHLDLAIGVSGLSVNSRQAISFDQIEWFGQKDLCLTGQGPVPLVLFEPPCPFREAALHALNEAGIEWQVTFTSPSLSGLRAAVEAGLGITARTVNSFRGQLPALSAESRLPALPPISFDLYAKPDLTQAAARLGDIVAQTVQQPALGKI